MTNTNHNPQSLSSVSREVFSRWASELSTAVAELEAVGEDIASARARAARVSGELAVTVARLEDSSREEGQP